MLRPFVLLIEDNLADAELSRAALSRLDFELELAHVRDGKEGPTRLLSALRRDAPPPAALVLLDLNLPGADGLELLQRLKQDPSTRSVPVVVFSGSRDPAMLRASLAQHANAFVRKADDLDRFVDSLRAVAEAFLVHAASPLSDE